MDKYVGSLEAGKLADFVILSDDIIAAFSDSIPNVKVVATFVGGQEMFLEQ